MAFKFSDLPTDPSAAPAVDADPNAPLTPPPAHAAAMQPKIEEPAGVITEAGRAVGGGIRDIGQGLIETVRQVLDPPSAFAAAQKKIKEGQSAEESVKDAGSEAAVRKSWTLPEVTENQSTLGAISREMVKWVGGTALLRKIPGVPKMPKGASLPYKMADQAVEGAVAGYVFTDPDAKNLGNLMENVPMIGDAINDFAGQDENSSAAINKLRGALENAVVGPLVAPIMHYLPAMVKAVKLRNAGKAAEADAVLAEAAPKIEKAMAKAQTEPIDLSLYKLEAAMDPASSAPKVAEAGVPVFRQSTKEGMAASDHLNFGESEAGVEMFAHKGSALHSMEIPKAELEKYRKSNILADPNADASLKQRILDEGGVPENEFLIPRSVAANASEHYGETGLGTKALKAETEALTQGNIAMGAADTGKLIDNIRISRTRGQDGAAFEFEGVINYSKLHSDDGVKQMITEVVRAAKEAIPDIAGPTYQSKADTIALAKRMGRDPVDLFNSLASMRMATGDMAAHIKAGDMLIQRIAKELDGDATRILAGKSELIDLAGFQVKADLLASTMDHVGGLRTEAARATAAGRYKVGPGGVTSANFMKVLEAAGGADYVAAMAQRLKMAGADGIPRSLVPEKGIFQKAVGIYNYAWVNAVLSGVKTSVVNFLTTGVNTAAMPGMRMVGGLVQEMTGAKGGMDQFYQGLYQYRTMRSTIMDSISMAAKAWRANGSVLDMASHPLEVAARMDPISELGMGHKAGLNMLGNIVGMPTRFLGAQDEFYKQITYRSHVSAQAWIEGTKRGLDGAALKNFVGEQLTKSVDENGKGLNDAALLAARNATFTQSLEAASYTSDRAWMAVANGAAQQVPVVKNLLVPFVRVPTNLFRQAWDMTPGLNLLRKQWLDDVRGGGEAGAMAIGKMGLGTTLWSAAGMLAYEGHITGGGPRDPDLRRQLGPDWKPYSFVTTNADGTKNYTSFARFDPFSHFFSVAADIAEVSGKVPEGEYAEILNRAGLALMANISSKTYLRSIADVFEAFTGDDAGIEKWVRSRVASHVPNLVQVLQGDDEVKDMRTWFDGFRSRIPGYADPAGLGYAANSVEAKRDNFGDKILPPMGHPFNATWPFAHFRGTDDPVRLELAALTRTKDEPKFPLPHWKQGPLDLREVKNPETGQTAYDRWLELHSTHKVGGQTLHEAMADLIKSPAYQAARTRMGEGDDSYKNVSLAVDMVQRKFEMYEDLTKIQLQREFKAMGADIGKAMMSYEIGKNTTRARGSNTATPVDQLRDLAGQGR